MYMKASEAVRMGYRLDAGAPFMWDRGDLVVFVPEAALVKAGGVR